MKQSGYIKQRLAQLDQNIQESFEMLRAYERKRRLAKDPRDREEFEDQITDVKRLLEENQREKESLEGQYGVQETPSDESKEQPIAGTGSDLVAAGQIDEAEIDLPHGLRQFQVEITRRLDELRDVQIGIYELLNERHYHELRMIISLILHRDLEQEELKQMLQSIQQAVSVLQEHENKLNTRIQSAVGGADSTLRNEASLQSKLELTLPIIPLILDYKVELAATNSVDLKKLVESAQNWWRSWTTRASNRAAQKLIKMYLEAFVAKQRYLSDFEGKLNQTASNPNTLLEAHEELTSLAGLSQSFIDALADLSITIEYPKNDLERSEELANNIANQARSAAAPAAGGRMPPQQINQIKQNLNTLQQLLEQIIAWLQEAV